MHTDRCKPMKLQKFFYNSLWKPDIRTLNNLCLNSLWKPEKGSNIHPDTYFSLFKICKCWINKISCTLMNNIYRHIHRA